MNRITLVGNIGADVEIRTTNAGAKVASFPVASAQTATPRGGTPATRGKRI